MIEVTDLVKDFPGVRALDRVSFRVGRGSVFGLIGPNGAGKTTCLGILATLLKPTSGTVTVGGESVTDRVQRIRRRLGYMPDFFGTYRRVTTFEYLDFFAGACGVPGERRPGRIDAVLALTHLEEKRDEFVDDLSRGMKQRLCLAKTLVHEPELLLLDEPAAGLDPRGRNEIRDILAGLAGQGVTVVISSHILSDLQGLCSHIGIMEQGKLVRSGAIAEILQSARPSGRAWRFRLDGDPAAAVAAVRALPYVLRVEAGRDGLLVELDPERLRETGQREDAVPAEVFRAVLESGATILAFAAEQGSLEDAFLNLTQGRLA